MHVHDHPADRRRADLQIRQALIVTQTGVWLVVMVIFMVIMPLFAPGVWPLTDHVEFASGHKVADQEGDVYVTVVASGEIFVDERRATFEELVAALRKPDAAFFVRVDRSAPFRSARAVIRAAQKAHCPRVTFVGRPAPPPPGTGLSLEGMWY